MQSKLSKPSWQYSWWTKPCCWHGEYPNTDSYLDHLRTDVLSRILSINQAVQLHYFILREAAQKFQLWFSLFARRKLHWIPAFRCQICWAGYAQTSSDKTPQTDQIKHSPWCMTNINLKGTTTIFIHLCSCPDPSTKKYLSPSRDSRPSLGSSLLISCTSSFTSSFSRRSVHSFKHDWSGLPRYQERCQVACEYISAS